jgi:hypothetical protein
LKDVSALEKQQLSNLRDWLLPMLINGHVKVKSSGTEGVSYKMNDEQVNIAAEPRIIMNTLLYKNVLVLKNIKSTFTDFFVIHFSYIYIQSFFCIGQ